MKILATLLSLLLSAYFYSIGSAQAAVELPLYVNIGANSAYVSTSGNTYLPDQAWNLNRPYGYIGGSTLSHRLPIGGTDESILYQTQRSGLSEYRIGLVPEGQYIVDLHFAELHAHNPGNTVFNIVIEDQTMATGLDPFRSAQNMREYAMRYRFLTNVTDDFLNIQFVNIAGKVQLAALSVAPYEPGSEEPLAPAPPKTTPSFEAVIVDWDEIPLTDIGGYFVYRSATAEGPFVKVTDSPIHTSRYIDQFRDSAFSNSLYAQSAPSAINWFYKLSTIDLLGNEGTQSSAVSAQPLSIESTSLPVYRLEMLEADFAQLSPDKDNNNRYPAKLAFAGGEYDVEVRYRGQITRNYAKKSWKIVLGNNSPFPDRNHIDLKSHYDDASLIRGVLTTQIYEQLGIAPSGAKHALLFVNGEYFGVYTDYERVDDNYLRRTQRNPNSTIYETLFSTTSNYGTIIPFENYPLLYDIRTNKQLGYRPLADLFERVNLTPYQFFAQTIEKAFNVQNYMKYYAGIIFTGNLDFTRHNVFFVNDPETEMWEIIPWDPDLTWGNTVGFSLSYTSNAGLDAGTFGGYETFNGPNQFLSNIIEQPQYKAYYCSQLQILADETYISQHIHPLIDSYHQKIKVAAYADWRKFGWEEHDSFDASVAGLKRFATERAQFLQDQFAEFCPQPTSLLKINEVATSSHMVACDPDERSLDACRDPWLELYNPSLVDVDLQGLYLTDDPAAPTKFRFEESVLIPPNDHILIWADNQPWQGATHTNFYIEDYVTSLSLIAADGRSVIDQLNISEHGHNIFVQRYPDGAPEEYVVDSTEASPGSSNRLAASIRSVFANPSEPDAGQETLVTVNLFPETEFIEGTLHYRVNGLTQSLPLKRTSYGQFTATIPGQPDQSHVEYYLTIKSYLGEEVSPASALTDDGFYQYLVGYHKPLLRINEIRADKDSGVLSWFEIYNDENVEVNMAGMFLSDDSNEPRKYEIPTALRPIQPGGFTVFYANNTPNLSSQHTNFALEPTNGSLLLTDRDETFNQPISSHSYGSAPEFGALQLCTNSGSIWSTTQSPTPGYANSPACELIYLPATSNQ